MTHPVDAAARPGRAWMENVAIVVATSAAGALLLAAASRPHGGKWFLMAIAAYVAACVFLLFEDRRVFCTWLIAAAIPLSIQYPLIPRRYSIPPSHGGGAPSIAMVHLVDFAIALAALMWLIDVGLGKRKLPRWTVVDTLVAAFLLLSLFSLYDTTEYDLLAFEMVRYAKYFLLFWILRTYVDGAVHVWGIIGISALVLLGQSLIAFLQYFLFFSLPFPVGGVADLAYDVVNGSLIQRVTGVVGHCNTFASYLLFPLAFLLVVCIARVPGAWKVAAATILGAGAAALVMTFSRNGWAGLALSVAIVAAIGLWKRRISLGVVVLLAVLAMFVAGALVASGVGEKVWTRIFDDEGKAYASRLDLFLVSFEMMRRYPLFGIGLNSFEENMTAYDSSGITNVIQQPVHNVYCLVAAETGLPSAALFLVIGAVMLARAWRLLRDRREIAFVTGAIGVTTFVSMLVFNLFDITARKEPVLGMLVLVAAMVMSFERDRAAAPESAP